MKHSEAIGLALGAIVLNAVVSVGAQTVRGMMWTEADGAKPIAMQGEECRGCYVIASNTFQQTDHGALEGYFAVGQAFDGMLRPTDPRFHWLREFRDKPVDVIIRVREPRKIEVIK